MKDYFELELPTNDKDVVQAYNHYAYAVTHCDVA